MVQRTGKAELDAATGNDWNDMADTLPDHSHQLWFCFRSSNSRQDQLAGRVTLCDQLHRECHLHSDSIWNAKPTACGRGHLRRMGDDPVVHVRSLEAL